MLTNPSKILVNQLKLNFFIKIKIYIFKSKFLFKDSLTNKLSLIKKKKKKTTGYSLTQSKSCRLKGDYHSTVRLSSREQPAKIHLWV